jgi:hypothetical protein
MIVVELFLAFCGVGLILMGYIIRKVAEKKNQAKNYMSNTSVVKGILSSATSGSAAIKKGARKLGMRARVNAKEIFPSMRSKAEMSDMEKAFYDMMNS